jgi:hypothetical protein
MNKESQNEKSQQKNTNSEKFQAKSLSIILTILHSIYLRMIIPKKLTENKTNQRFRNKITYIVDAVCGDRLVG